MFAEESLHSVPGVTCRARVVDVTLVVEERVVDTRVNVKVECDPSGLQISLELSHHVGVHEAVVLGEKAENREPL